MPAKRSRINAILERRRQTDGFNRYVKPFVACNGIALFRKFFRGRIQDRAGYAEILFCIFQFGRSYIRNVHFSAFCLGGNGGQHADGACAYNQHFVSFFDMGPGYAMPGNAERLDKAQYAGGQSFSVIDPFYRHGNIFAERAVPLAAHGLIAGAGIYDAAFAGIAVAAVKIRIAGDDHARFQPFIIFVNFNDLCRKFMTGNAGIIKIGKGSPVRTQIASADAAVQNFQ